MLSWILMMIINMVVPLMMIVVGHCFAKNAPKTINYTVGYRTKMSMKNKDTWEFAHHYFGRLWNKAGWVLFIATVIAMLPLIGRTEDAVGIFGGLLCGVQAVLAVVPIFATESALHKTFDKNGFRKN